MPGFLIKIESDGHSNLHNLTHNRDCFGTNEVTFDNIYFGVVDFKNRIDDDLLAIPEERLGIAVFGDVYFNRQYDKTYRGKNKIASFKILELYKKYGMDFVQTLSGSYSLAIHDGNSNKTIVIVDRIGSKPIYYRETVDGIILSSEIKGVIGNKDDLEYDMDAIYEFFSFSYPLSNKSFFKNIKTLPPASVFIYDDLKKEKRVERYWNYSDSYKNSLVNNENDLLKLFDIIFTHSIRKRIEKSGSIGIFLSGGLDSRILAGYCKELCVSMGKHLVFYTFGTPGGIEDKIAKKISTTLGVEYQLFEIPSAQISSYAHEIVINGDGHFRIRDAHFVSGFDELALTHDCYLAAYLADTVFGKHISNCLSTMKKKEELINYLLEKYLIKSIFKKASLIFRNIEYADLMKSARKAVQETVEKLPEFPVYQMFHCWDLEQRGRRYMVPISNYGNWYLPISDPFIDKDLLDFAINLPFDMLMNKNFLRKVLKSRFPKLNKIELERGYLKPDSNFIYRTTKIVLNKVFFKSKETIQRLFGGKILFRNKGYRAYDYWLRTGSKEFFINVLENIDDCNRFDFDPGQIKKLLEDHLTCKCDNNQILCNIVNLILLDKYYTYSMRS